MEKSLELLTYPEFLEKIWKCDKVCIGCKDSVKQYIEDYLPWYEFDYEKMKVPKEILSAYEDENFNFNYGQNR